MTSAIPNGEKSEGSLLSVSGIPNITSEKLNGKNYLAWSASVEVWFLGQGHYDHLEKSSDEISEEKRDLWQKVDYQLCAVLWQSVEPDILLIFRAFKTCHTFWKKAQHVFGYDTQGLYDSAKKLVTLKQCDHDMISFVSKAQSVVEELKTYMQADTLEEIKNKCDNLLKMLVLQGMHPDYEHVRHQILTSQELPSMENLFIRLLQVNWEGHCGGGCPQRSRCKRMRSTQDACSSFPGLPEEMEMMKKEKEEKEHKKKQSSHLYTIIIKVARDEDLFEQIGNNLYFDLVDHDKVRSFRVSQQMSFHVFEEEIAKEFGVPVPFQRYWLWTMRDNLTYRLDQPLTHLEKAQPVGQLRGVSNKAHSAAELHLFLEVELGLDLRPIAPPEKTKNDILLFFKLYEPEQENLRYVGRLFVKSSGKPSEILTRLNEMAGYDPDEHILLYEEIRFEPDLKCPPIEKNITFSLSGLGDGDIVCYQKVSKEDIDYPYVPIFLELEYLHRNGF